MNFSHEIMKTTYHLSKHPPSTKGKDLGLRYILKIKTSINCDVSKPKLRKQRKKMPKKSHREIRASI